MNSNRWRRTPAVAQFTPRRARVLREGLGEGEANAAVIDASCVVTESHQKKDDKPKNAGNDDELRAPRHKLGVHEVQDHQCALGSGDSEGDYDIERTEIDVGGGDS